MQTFEDIKNLWNETRDAIPKHASYDQKKLEYLVKSRTKKNMKTVMQYFWAAFVLQILVYALLSHVILKYFMTLFFEIQKHDRLVNLVKIFYRAEELGQHFLFILVFVYFRDVDTGN